MYKCLLYKQEKRVSDLNSPYIIILVNFRIVRETSLLAIRQAPAELNKHRELEQENKNKK